MHDPAASALGGIVITIAVLFLLFIALRAVMLWYWKINTIVERLDQILAELKKPNNP